MREGAKKKPLAGAGDSGSKFEAAESLEAAVAHFASERSEARPAPAPASPRYYAANEVAVLLAIAAITGALLDSDGFLTWVNRLAVGKFQNVCLAVAIPLNGALEEVGLTRPRQLLAKAADGLSSALGAGGDPLLAGAWKSGALEEPVQQPVPKPLPESKLALPESPPSEEIIAAPTAPPPEPGGAAKLRVLLLGDSLIAGSLGTALRRTLEKTPGVRVTEAFQTATGLSRPELFDWTGLFPALLERDRPEVVIASLGANDGQDIREGGKLLEVGSAAWKAAYSSRVLSAMQTLAGGGRRVLWLGLPTMRDPVLNARARQLNQLFTVAASRVRGVEVLEVQMLLSGPDGRYATFISGADGAYLRVRMDDGVHYTPAGARSISRWVIDWLRERLKAKRLVLHSP